MHTFSYSVYLMAYEGFMFFEGVLFFLEGGRQQKLKKSHQKYFVYAVLLRFYELDKNIRGVD